MKVKESDPLYRDFLLSSSSQIIPMKAATVVECPEPKKKERAVLAAHSHRNDHEGRAPSAAVGRFGTGFGLLLPSCLHHLAAKDPIKFCFVRRLSEAPLHLLKIVNTSEKWRFLLGHCTLLRFL